MFGVKSRNMKTTNLKSSFSALLPNSVLLLVPRNVRKDAKSCRKESVFRDLLLKVDECACLFTLFQNVLSKIRPLPACAQRPFAAFP